MTSWEIIVVLAGIPLAIMVLLALLTLVPSAVRTRRERYRFGQQWHHPPVWWTADPERLSQRQGRHHSRPGTGAGYGGCRGNW